MKTCTQCKLPKRESEFYRVQRGKYSMSECKVCFSDRAKEHYKIPEVRVRRRINKQNWVERNREKHNELRRNWDQSHKEITRARGRLTHYRKRAERFGIVLETRIRRSYGTVTAELLEQEIEKIKELIHTK